MDELNSIAKVIAATGGGTALLVWTVRGALPSILETWKHYLEWRLRHREQTADLEGTKARLLIEQDLAVHKIRTELTGEMREEIKTLRAEVAGLHASIAVWMDKERGCREEVHALRNAMNVLVQQNNLKTSTENDMASLLHAMADTHPEWFGAERRRGDRRKTDPEKP